LLPTVLVTGDVKIRERSFSSCEAIPSKSIHLPTQLEMFPLREREFCLSGVNLRSGHLQLPLPSASGNSGRLGHFSENSSLLDVRITGETRDTVIHLLSGTFALDYTNVTQLLIILMKTPWPESAGKLYRPSDHRLSAKVLRIERCRVVSVTFPTAVFSVSRTVAYTFSSQ
jgi:hypothetical protein